MARPVSFAGVLRAAGEGMAAPAVEAAPWVAPSFRLPRAGQHRLLPRTGRVEARRTAVVTPVEEVTQGAAADTRAAGAPRAAEEVVVSPAAGATRAAAPAPVGAVVATINPLARKDPSPRWLL